MQGGHRTIVYTFFGTLAFAFAIRTRRPLLFKLDPRTPMDESLGLPREGVHCHRFLGAAVTDFVATLLWAAMCTRISNGSFTAWVVSLLVLGEIQHAWFGIPTATYRWFFMDEI